MKKPQRIKPNLSISMGSHKAKAQEYYNADEIDAWHKSQKRKMRIIISKSFAQPSVVYAYELYEELSKLWEE